MALKTAALLLSLALAVHATDFDGGDALHNKLNNDINSVCNELLGIPCKDTNPPPNTPPNYPPQPSPSTPPQPSPSTPPPQPSPNTPPPPQPTPNTPPAVPPTQPPPAVPPTLPPNSPPVNPPTPGPAPPAGDGQSTATFSLIFPDGYTLTPEDQQKLVDILQNVLGTNALIQSASNSGSRRKLLDVTKTINLVITNVKNCAALVDLIEQFIESGDFARAARAAGVPLLGAGGLNIICSGPTAGAESAQTPPAQVQGDEPPPPTPITPTPGPSP